MTDFKDKEQELNNLFENMDDLNKTNSFQMTIKKAKRNSILRNIFVSVIVLIFAFGALGFTWLSLMRHNQENAARDISLFSHITSPNIQESGFQNVGNGFFEGILYFNRYKEIDGTPVDWSDNVVTYSIFGGVSKLLGDHSPIQFTDSVDGLPRYYDRETKQRIMEFYHPEVKYRSIRNDLAKLNEISDEERIEMALSFDGKYTPQEVRRFLPETVTLKWYWADTYTDVENLKEKKVDPKADESSIPAFPELADHIYGFDHYKGDPSESEKLFVNDIESGIEVKDGKYYSEFKRIHQYIKGDSQKIKPENVRVLGVVVTGTAKELESLKNVNEVRASVFGVKSKRYE
jgi:Sigma factor regulator C-terminal/Sigma factor regulator N-terminal